jgi:hypothetical protein
LRVKSGECRLETAPDILTNFGPVKTLVDLSTGGTYSGGVPKNYVIVVDGASSPNTFKWNHDGSFQTFTHAGIAMTGSEQDLEDGITITWGAITGHSVGDAYIICYDGPPSYYFKIGKGTQTADIKDVYIHGSGSITQNAAGQRNPSGYAKDLSAAILVYGKCNNILIEDVKIDSSQRAIMAYGYYEGGVLAEGGAVWGGISRDLVGLTIQNVCIDQEVSGYAGILLGHPEKRGFLKNVKVIGNTINCTNGCPVELNFNLSDFIVMGNRAKANSGTAYYCWRHCERGIVANNTVSGSGVIPFGISAPIGWAKATDIIAYGNINTTTNTIFPVH